MCQLKINPIIKINIFLSSSDVAVPVCYRESCEVDCIGPKKKTTTIFVLHSSLPHSKTCIDKHSSGLLSNRKLHVCVDVDYRASLGTRPGWTSPVSQVNQDVHQQTCEPKCSDRKRTTERQRGTREFVIRLSVSPTFWTAHHRLFFILVFASSKTIMCLRLVS